MFKYIVNYVLKYNINYSYLIREDAENMKRPDTMNNIDEWNRYLTNFICLLIVKEFLN